MIELVDIPVKYFPPAVAVPSGETVRLSVALNPLGINLSNWVSARNAYGNPEGASDAW